MKNSVYISLSAFLFVPYMFLQIWDLRELQLGKGELNAVRRTEIHLSKNVLERGRTGIVYTFCHGNVLIERQRPGLSDPRLKSDITITMII